MRMDSLCTAEVLGLELQPRSGPKCRRKLKTSPKETRVSHEGLASKRKMLRNAREKERVQKVNSSIDDLQSRIWRERVRTKHHRRPRLFVLQLAARYIALLAAASRGELSSENEQLLLTFLAVNQEDAGNNDQAAMNLRATLAATKM